MESPILLQPMLPHTLLSTGRTLTTAASCPSSFRALNSTFNSNPDVPSYTGIMFEVLALKDMDILSLELDISLDAASNIDSIPVEIYTFPGPFDSVVGFPSAWSLVAETHLVPAPDDSPSMIVPVDDFTPVSLQAFEKHSLYITLTGPYLDHTVDALDKTGEMYVANDDIQLFVGEGTHEYKFPERMDTVLDPKFAGVVHYQLKDSSTCSGSSPETITTTTIEYTYMTDLSSDVLRESLQEALADYHAYAYSTTTDVNVPSPSRPVSVIYNGECPLEWKDCPSNYYTVKVPVVHNSVAYTEGDIAYSFFQPQLLNLVEETVTKRRGRSIYLGHTSTLASFSIGLLGVGPLATQSEAEYFQFVTKTFLQDATPSDEALVWGVVVEDHPDERLLRRTQAEQTTIRGVVRGAIPVGAKVSSFRFSLEAAFRKNQALYRSMMLETGKLRPGHPGWVSFAGFQNAIADFETLALPQTIASQKRSKHIVGAVFGSIAGVAFVIALALLYRHQQIKARNYRELMEYRAEKRRERRAKRAASTKLQDEPDTKDGTSLGAQIACGSTYMSCLISTTDAQLPPTEPSKSGLVINVGKRPEATVAGGKPRRTPLAQHLDSAGTEATVQSGSSSYSIGSYSAAKERRVPGKEQTQRPRTEQRATRGRGVPSQLSSNRVATHPRSQPVARQLSAHNTSARLVDEKRVEDFIVKRPDLSMTRDPPPTSPSKPMSPREKASAYDDKGQLSGVEVTMSNKLSTWNESSLPASAFAVSHDWEPSTRAKTMKRTSSYRSPTESSAPTMQRAGSLRHIPTKEIRTFSPSADARAFSRTRSHSPGLGTLPATLPKRVARP